MGLNSLDVNLELISQGLYTGSLAPQVPRPVLRSFELTAESIICGGPSAIDDNDYI